MKKVTVLPKFMAQGSKGPQVSLLHAFLCGTKHGNGIQFDEEFGDVTTQNLKRLQQFNELNPDGCFGPETRDWAKTNYNFDFEQACQKLQGEMIFCDLDEGLETVLFEN